MIFSELMNVFKNDYYIECLKRGIPEDKQIRFNNKQLKLIFTKTLSDLQKEFHIIESSKTILSVNGNAAYALDRSNIKINNVYYDGVKLEGKNIDFISNQEELISIPEYYALLWKNAYPILILYPTPQDDNKNIIVKSYNDIEIYSYNDGIDTKISDNESVEYYIKIPTMYDQAVLFGMLSSLFDDRYPLYQKEKLRLKALAPSISKIKYHMTGIPEDEEIYYNPGIDDIPTIIPGEPI